MWIVATGLGTTNSDHWAVCASPVINSSRTGDDPAAALKWAIAVEREPEVRIVKWVRATRDRTCSHDVWVGTVGCSPVRDGKLVAGNPVTMLSFIVEK